jgi:hypothetical protein
MMRFIAGMEDLSTARMVSRYTSMLGTLNQNVQPSSLTAFTSARASFT